MLLGNQIRLSPATPEDAPLIANWFGDPAYMGDYYNVWPTTHQEFAERFARPTGRDQGFLLIRDQATAQPLGTIGYWNPFTLTELFHGLELWWQVHPDFRGRGIATQAACLLVNHLFNSLPVERLQATVVIGNTASSRVATGAGMQCDGVYRSVYFLHGRFVDLHLFAIVRGDWQDTPTYRQARRPF
ncbi:MAG: GNAT family N-acetyltransferase [Chloroflexaceae bacterium]